MFFSISNFRSRIAALLKVKRGIYAGVEDEIRTAFRNMTIEQIRNNRDMILIDEPLIFIKLRLPDRKHHLSRKDGYRLIYLVYKTEERVVFLDIYPKNGPAQQLIITDNDLADLLEQFIAELQTGTLKEFNL